MRETFPRSPFSTRFSGREGETRLRVLSIAQGQHRRPAALVLALALAAILSCGGLVSCRVKAEQPALSQLLTDEILTDDILNGDSILAGGDLDDDGQEEALCTPALVYKLWPDGSLWQLNLRNTVLELLELDADAPLELTYLPGQQKISAQWLGDRRTFPLKELLDGTRSGLILSAGEDSPEGVTRYFREGLDLTGDGTADDRVLITSYGYDTEDPATLTEITLATGEVLTLRCYDRPSFSSAFPLRLSAGGRQALVLALSDSTSNYGYTQYRVLTVEDGQLVELPLPAESSGSDTVYGGHAVAGNGGPDALRLPTLLDKWHGFQWHTLTWDEQLQTWAVQSDGFFTDYGQAALADGRTLTLELRGRWTADHALYYDRVQILDGAELLQTITPDFPADSPLCFDRATLARATVPAGNYNPLGFSADAALHHLSSILDVNFDGNQDIGLPVDTTHDNYHLWYCWDPGAEQFVPAFALQGVPETDEARGLLIEHPFDSPDMAYTFNARGQLVWLGTLEEQANAERSAP